jgi:S1/P1 Nuclease
VLIGNSSGAHITDGFDLGMDYYNFAVPIVDEQLAKGGIRLAYLLNNVFSDTSISCASSNSGSSSGSGAGME